MIKTRAGAIIAAIGFFVLLPLGSWVGSEIVQSASSIIQLDDGDKLAVESADGCELGEVGAGSVLKREFTCTATTTTTIPPTTTTTTPPPGSQPPNLVTGGTQWTYLFNENFDGTAINTTRWNVINNSTYGDANNTEHRYMAANVTVSNGTANLLAKPDLTSGMITTRQQGGALKFKYRHGYTEIRMRAPSGAIYWPAFWLVGAGDGSSPSWPAYGEFDISEIYGPQPSRSESNAHFTGGNIGGQVHNVGSTLDWHTYGFDWTANRLDWYIDGVLVRRHNATSAQLAALNYEHSIHINLALGGSGPEYYGYRNGTGTRYLPGALEIDYVKVWARP